jgi:DNA-binding CsgD family transcriptional regulator
MSVLAVVKPDAILPLRRCIGVWAPDPFTERALVAATQDCCGAEMEIITRDLSRCDLLIVAEDESGTEARFAAGRATADRMFPVLWIRSSGTSAVPRSAVVVEVLNRSEVSSPRFAAAVRRVFGHSHSTVTAELGCPDTLSEPDIDYPDSPTEAAPLSNLAPRELEVLRLLAAGESTASIAERLFYSDRTVTNLIHRLGQRIGARNRAQAVAMAVRAGVA